MLRVAQKRLFNNVGIWGGGTMGAGIAQVTAVAGVKCHVVEVSKELAEKSKKGITGSLARVAKKKFESDPEKGQTWVNDVLGRINFTDDAMGVAKEVDAIIEAMPENLEIKNKLWQSVDPVAQEGCVFITNTSSLSVADQSVVTKRPDRFGGLHFFSPVPMMKLVEVIATEKTSPETTKKIEEFSKKIGKKSILAKDTPGFVVNRLLLPYMTESCLLVERGVATIEDVDVGMQLGCGHPMGPFRLMDAVGLDVLKLIYDQWHAKDPKSFQKPKLIDEKVNAGKFGMKNGEGFYKYK